MVLYNCLIYYNYYYITSFVAVRLYPALYTTEPTESGAGGSVVESRTDDREVLGSNLPVSFGGDTKSHWSLLSGTYATGSKRWGKCVTCLGVVDSATLRGQL